LKKILLVILILFLGVVAFLGTTALAMFKGWPGWSGLIALAVIWGGPILYYVIIGFIGWLGRRRYAKSLLLKDKSVRVEEGSELLRRHWRQGMLALRPRSFGGDVDPVNDLGWFLILGGPSSGKRELLLESGLLNVLRAKVEDQDAAARDLVGCDWYLFENSVVLDPKGLVSEPGSKVDPVEWETFISLLKESGRQKPLEGVVLTIPGELLDPDREEDLKAAVVERRERLDALAQATDQLAPIYLVFTRLDVWPRMSEGLKLLESHNRPTGLIFDQSLPLDSAVAREVLEDRVREIFIQNLNPLEPEAQGPVLAFPDSLSHFERSLSKIIAILSHRSPYVPAPKVKGLFFSTRKDDSPDERPEMEGPTKTGSEFARTGLVKSLSDFLTRILPANRNLTERLNLPGGRRQKVILGFFLAYYVLTLAFSVILCVETRHNQKMSQVVQQIKWILSDERLDNEHFLGRSDSLDYILDELESVDERFVELWPWTSRAERFKNDVELNFQHSFEVANSKMMAALEEQIKDETSEYQSKDFGLSLRQLLWLFEVFNTYDSRGDYVALAQNFPLTPQDFHGPTENLWTLVYNKLLFEYLNRVTPGPGPKKYLEESRRLVSTLISNIPFENFKWVMEWTANLPGVKSVSIDDIWRLYGLDLSRTVTNSAEGVIPGAYTLEGRQAIFDMVEQLKMVYSHYQGKFVEEQTDDFKSRYDNDYVSEWRQWVKAFLQVSQEPNWVSFLGEEFRTDSQTSPYDRVLDLLIYHLKPYLGSDTAPVWLKNLELDWAVAQWIRIQDNIKTSHKATDKVTAYSAAFEVIRAQMPEYFYRTDFLKRILEAEPHDREFDSELAKIVNLVDGHPDEAVKLAESHFGGLAYGDASKSAFTLANAAINNYSKCFYPASGGVDAIVVSLKKAALNYLKAKFLARVARRIDDIWRSDVVNPVRFLSPEDANKALYGPEGLLLTFQKTHAAPFLNDDAGTFQARHWGDLSFPFTGDFLHLLSVGGESAKETIKDSYSVTISGLASLVDEKAVEKPQRTSVTLRSVEATQTLDIFNYPTAKTFTFKPAVGGNVELAIILPSVELYVNYEGPLAFAGFLRDILSGQMVFTPEDFPERKERLEALGISEIRVIIKADGAIPVIHFLRLDASPLPNSIIKAHG
jgi:hypothetical protein